MEIDDRDVPLKAGSTILEQESADALRELARPALGLFLSGLIAGFSVGTSVLVMAVVLSSGGELSELTLRLMLANAYAIGFIMVVLSHTDLFTEYTTIALLPAFTGDASVSEVARLWALVYVSNIVAAAAFAWVAVVLGPGLHVAELEAFRAIASKLIDHDAWVVVLSSVLAGWLMGVMSWLVSAGRDTISQIVFVWLIAFTIGLLGLHHCITGTVQILVGVFAGEASGWADYGRMLALMTFGNVVGGFAFAAMIRYSVMVSRAA
jgi:formate-nitrite transporter family protein